MNNNNLFILMGLLGIYLLAVNSRKEPIYNPPVIDEKRGITEDLIKWVKILRDVYGFTSDTINQLWGPGGPFYKGITQEQAALITQAFSYI